MNATPTLDIPRELAYRVTDGLEVALLWYGSTDRILVSVIDETTGDRFEIPADGPSALDVFYHPFPHAAAKGIPYRTGAREPEETLCP